MKLNRIAMVAVTACAAMWSVATAATLKVVSATANEPVAGAVVMDNGGAIVGFTDDDGSIDIADGVAYPVAVRCLGFEAVNLDAFAPTVTMTPVLYPLSEVTVKPGERPIRRIVTYVREYSICGTDRDTTQGYYEYMAESFDTERKVKGYQKSDARARMANYRGYSHTVNPATGLDSVARPKRDDGDGLFELISMVASASVKGGTIVPELINGGSRHAVMGKYYPKRIFRRSGQLYTITDDILADSKNHTMSPGVLKLLGMTLDITCGNFTTAFRPDAKGNYSLDEMIYKSINFEATLRGKWFKKAAKSKEPVKARTYIEVYPVAIEHLTVEEYQEARAERPHIPFKKPQGLLPLAPAVKALVDRVNAEIPPL